MAGTCEQEETSEDEVGKIGGFKSWGVIWNTPHTSCQRFEISFKWKLKKETKNFAFLLNYHCRKWTFRGKSGTPISNLGDNVAWIKVLKVDMVTSKYDVWFGGWNMSRLYIVTLLILFTFCHKGGIICISEVIDISPSSLDSSLYLPTQHFAWCTLHIS